MIAACKYHKNPEHLVKITDMWRVSNKLYYIMIYQVHLTTGGIQTHLCHLTTDGIQTHLCHLTGGIQTHLCHLTTGGIQTHLCHLTTGGIQTHLCHLTTDGNTSSIKLSQSLLGCDGLIFYQVNIGNLRMKPAKTI
jgi:hypothetical protein